MFGRPADFDNSRTMIRTSAVGAGGRCLDIFLLPILSFFLALAEGLPTVDGNAISKYRKTQNNHPTFFFLNLVSYENWQ